MDKMIEIFRWLVGVSLTILGVFVVGVNGWIFYRTMLRKLEAPSVVPLVGGFIAMIGLFTLPFDISINFLILPVALDWGGVPGLIVAALQGNFK